jgi:membrane dipeptidase
MLTFDAHLDLSINALAPYNRDLRMPVHEIRHREQGMTDIKGRAAGAVAFPEMRKGGIGLCVATQIAGCMRGAWPFAGWASPEQAWAESQAQLSWYHAMEECGEMRQIRDLRELDAMIALWTDGLPNDTKPIGYILSLEGADSVRTVRHLERHWEQGLRAIGPAHYGVCRYAIGHDIPGGLPPGGADLIREIDRLGMILDVTHLSDECFWQALEIFQGTVWASHSNCRALVPDVRQFSDEQIKALIERGAVLGAALDAWMMSPGWIRGKTTPCDSGVKLEWIADHLDHIAQLAGNSHHSGLGTDLDGGFGIEQTPADLDTIADIAKLPDILSRRGWKMPDIENVMSGNFLRLIHKAWSK